MTHESSEHKILFSQHDVTLSSYSQFFCCEIVKLTDIAYLTVREAFWDCCQDRLGERGAGGQVGLLWVEGLGADARLRPRSALGKHSGQVRVAIVGTESVKIRNQYLK